MILAAVDPGLDTDSQRKFRGKNIRFWYGRLFPGVSWWKPGIQPEPFSCLFLFDPTKYLDVSTAGVTELLTLLRENPPGGDTILTLEGFPLYILGRDVCGRLWKDGTDSVTPDLRDRGDTKRIQLQTSFRVFSVDSEPHRVEAAVCSQQIRDLSAAGVVVEDTNHFYIEGGIPVGRGSIISTGVVVKGASDIGAGVRIHPYAYIENTMVGENCHILPFCVLRDSVLEADVQVGPFTHIRNNSLIREGAKAGNFVELKKSELGKSSKSMHLSYLGDAEIGAGVNIGAGTITCNYDGEKKHPTIIGDGVFIGSGTELAAPVKVGKDSYIGAGSTVTDDVPEASLAIARQRQVNKPGWVRKRKKKK